MEYIKELTLNIVAYALVLMSVLCFWALMYDLMGGL